MRVIKVNAIWCSGCLVMNKIWKKIENDYLIETINYDYDLDYLEIAQYNVGNILPVFIFLNEKDMEVKRLIGEVSEKALRQTLNILEEKNEG